MHRRVCVRVVSVSAGTVVVGGRRRVSLVGVVRVAVVGVAGVTVSRVVRYAVLVVVVVDFELRLAGRRAVVVVVGVRRRVPMVVVRVMRMRSHVRSARRGRRVVTRCHGLGCGRGLLAAALGARDGHPAELKLLSLRRRPREERADVQTHILVGTLGGAKVGAHAAARRRQKRVIGNQALARLGVKHPHKGLGMVGTTLDLDGVLRVLLEIEASVQAGRAAVLVAGDDEAIACLGANSHLLVGGPLVAGPGGRVHGDGFGHVTHRCVRAVNVRYWMTNDWIIYKTRGKKPSVLGFSMTRPSVTTPAPGGVLRIRRDCPRSVFARSSSADVMPV